MNRHRELVRLTGTHPFNVEPPLPLLMECGFITPVNLHLMRNHGAVPNLSWDSHRVHVTGAVGRKSKLSMNQLVRGYPSYTIPVLVVCAGNRRKEQNMLRKTIGFNWGPGGLGNSLWTGVPLHVILRAHGVDRVTPKRRFVCFKGPAGELPKGDDGSYGTSIPLEKALDPAEDVMVGRCKLDPNLKATGFKL